MENSIRDFNAEYEQYITTVLKNTDFPKELIEKYHVDECISVSNTSEVYLIKNRISHQKYILKIIKSLKSKGDLNEESLLKILKHKGIPELIEHYTNGKYQFIIKTYFEGLSLYDYVMNQGGLDIKEVFHITEQLLDILSYLHIQSPPIINRDIKPQNIIYTPEKEVKLIDFDIARQFRQEERYDTVYLGTRDYAPPEQFGFCQTDQRTDIYSIGMLMFFLLTGHTEIKSIDTHIQGNKIKKLIEKCTAFSPKERYANVNQLRKAITYIKDTKRKVLRYIKGVFCGIFILLLSVFVTKQQEDIQKIDSTIVLTDEANIQETQIISFSDKNLENVIREVINKPTGDMFLSDVQMITSLDAESKNIESLEGIQYLSNLIVLGLWENDINDISPIKSLSQLEQLFLDGNNISDLKPLSMLNRVFNLGLGGNNIQDISPLANLANLQMLNISNNYISDLEPLLNINFLECLDLSGRNNITDFSPLKNISTLKELEIYGDEDFDDFDVLE